MLRARVQKFFVAVAYLSMAGCATAPTGDRVRIIDIPLASAYSDIAFTMTTGSRQSVACDENTSCPTQSDRDAAIRFALQVQRLAGALQNGAQHLYPDLAQRVPELADSRFDVYVVKGDLPGSASSANGRIVLNTALGAWHSYDEWLAFVIAREMGHVIARHHPENSAASITTSVIMNILVPGSGLLKSVICAGGSRVAAISQRDVQALEADAIALGLLEAAGFRRRDVSLSLRIAPALPDDGLWSKNFRKSSDNLLAEVRNSELAVGLVMREPQFWQGPAKDLDK